MESHFDNIADIYNKVWHFSDKYKEWMLNNIINSLKFDENDVFVDIGGGTAVYTELIANTVNLKNTSYCIEPSVEMSKVAKENTNINVYNEDGNQFSERPLNYDKVLLKEVIHHITDRKTLWNKLHKRLNNKGRILIVTRPQKIKMPLFESAKKEFYQNQPPYETFVTELSNASFNVNVKIDSFYFSLDKEVWFNMLRQRFMSDLGKFTDKEIEDGIDELKNTFTSDKIEIEDEIIFITSSK